MAKPKNADKPETTAQAEAPVADLVPLKKLCLEAKLDPKTARRKLRKAKFDFHAMKDRWAFKPDSEELAACRKALGLDVKPKAVAVAADFGMAE